MTGLRWALAALMFGLGGAVCAAADDVATIEYAVSPVIERGALKALAVEIRFTGERDGTTQLELPNEWGGRDQLYTAVRGLKAEGAQIEAAPVPWARMLLHRPGARITVRYRVVQTWPGEPVVTGDNEYRPIVQPGYFQAVGNAVFATPAWDQDRTRASFAFNGLPQGWRFASDLEHARYGRKLVLSDIFQSIMVGGDFRVIERGKLRVAIRGKWPFTDEAFIARLEPIVASHQKFWSDPDEPYLVTVLPLKGQPGDLSLGGTGLDDAFAFFASANVDEARLTRVLAHEHLHTWIPARLGGLPKENEASDYWLSEGFTDFYTLRLLARDGLYTPEQFIDAANEILTAYANSTARTAPNAVITRTFWQDRDVGDLPYQRGFLLATLWDYELRKATNGARDLDDVVLAMKTQSRSATSAPPLATDAFAPAIKVAGVDVSSDLDALVEKGEAVLLPADTFGPCGTVETVQVANFDRGFDSERSAQAGHVVGMDPTSPAYAAGLRDGMKIVKREAGEPGNSAVEIVYRVDDHGTERLIRFYPKGKRMLTVQTIKPAADLATPAVREACVKRLGGL